MSTWLYYPWRTHPQKLAGSNKMSKACNPINSREHSGCRNAKHKSNQQSLRHSTHSWRGWGFQVTTGVHAWDSPSFCVVLQPGRISPPRETTQEPGSSLFHAGFLCKCQVSFSVICQGGTAAGPHITETGWRQIHESTSEAAAAGTNRDKKPWEKNWSGVCSIPIPALQKGFLTFRKSLCNKREHPAWKVKCDPRSVEGSGHQSLCSQLFHRLWRAWQTPKTIWNVTRKWDNDAF